MNEDCKPDLAAYSIRARTLHLCWDGNVTVLPLDKITSVTQHKDKLTISLMATDPVIFSQGSEDAAKSTLDNIVALLEQF